MKQYLNNEQKDLVKNNIRLADKIAQRRNNVVYNEDTRSYARVGLCKAALAYDKTKGIRFSTYAYRVINRTITEELNRMRLDTGNISIWRNSRVNERQELHSQATASEILDTIPCVNDMDIKMTNQQIRNMITRYLGKIPIEERKVLELRYGLNDLWKVYTKRDIAKKLHIAEATVRCRERRGLERLRRWIELEGVLDVYA